jgi:hypothetical protein
VIYVSRASAFELQAFAAVAVAGPSLDIVVVYLKAKNRTEIKD